MKEQIRISDWVNQQLSSGKYTFTLVNLHDQMPEKTHASIKLALRRLVDKNKIVSVSKGFYQIISPAYQNMGILPPNIFIDDLMHHLGRPYYVSLLSAAALHGSAHQQPQSYFVCTTLPSMRPTKKKGLRIKYVSKRNFPNSHIVQKKTESGYVYVSDSILTCIDLINHFKIIGGFSRAATVINELSDEINIQINPDILHLASFADLQRLGYLWEFECKQVRLANSLFNLLKDSHTFIKPYKLNPTLPFNKKNTKNRWKINVNLKIEIDE